MSKHNCGVCAEGFDTEEQYCDHACNTGFTPKDIEHQDALTDGQFSKQSAEALKRGDERKESETVVDKVDGAVDTVVEEIKT